MIFSQKKKKNEIELKSNDTNENNPTDIFNFNIYQQHYDKYDLQDFIKRKRNRADGYINNKLSVLDKNSSNYNNDYETLKFAQIFVDLYKNKLNERE